MSSGPQDAARRDEEEAAKAERLSYIRRGKEIKEFINATDADQLFIALHQVHEELEGLAMTAPMTYAQHKKMAGVIMTVKGFLSCGKNRVERKDG